MNRRSALLVALAVAVAAVATLLLARRGRAINAAATVPPTPLPVAPVRTAAPPPVGQTQTGEQPLPTWARVAIVGAALLAFLAVSMIATRSG